MTYNKNVLVLFFIFIIIFLLNKLEYLKKNYGGSGLDNMPDGPQKEKVLKNQQKIRKSVTQLDNYAKTYEENYIKKKQDTEESYWIKKVNNYFDTLEKIN